ncbi:MAG TPA: hypothetical protein VGD21_09170 [Lysobacter sp.]
MSNITDKATGGESGKARDRFWANIAQTNAASGGLLSDQKGAPNFLASAAFAAFRVCTHAVSNSISAQAPLNVGEAQRLPDEVRDISLRVFADLQAIPDDDLVFGARMERMAVLFAEYETIDSRSMCDALTRVALTDSPSLADEAKAAAIRYLGIYQSRLRSSDLTKMFFSVADAASEEAAIAAARSLGDIGNLGTIPALTAAIRTKEGTATAREMRKAIRTIEKTHGIDPNS